MTCKIRFKLRCSQKLLTATSEVYTIEWFVDKLVSIKQSVAEDKSDLPLNIGSTVNERDHPEIPPAFI